MWIPKPARWSRGRTSARGYEVAKGQYLIVEDEEFDAVQIESTRTIDIDQFVPKNEIDERYIDSPYYIAPDGQVGQDAFAVIRDTIGKMNMVALGRVVLTRREHVIALEPKGRGLMGMTLRYPYEVRDEAPYFEDIPELKLPKEMLDLATHIVNTKSGHFDPSQFEDRYENALIDLLKKKEAGEKIEPVTGRAGAARGQSDGRPSGQRRRREKEGAGTQHQRLVGLLKGRQAKSESPASSEQPRVMTPVELDSSALKSSVAFTGRLACMTRAEAFEVVRQHGGTPSQAVTKRTKLLIVGELGWPLLDDGRPSNKLSRATAYGVPVVSERRFLEWIGKAVPDSVHKTYSADQLAALSKLSSDKIQELAQFGLLDERGGRFGFRDLASARQIAKLLADGVRLSEIIRA